MSEINLYSYQQPFYNDIMTELMVNNVKSVCAVLPTGGGKSVIIGKLAHELPGRTLILTHRIEILTQNSEWLKEASILTANENGLKYGSKIVIAMVQTLYARIKKYGIQYIGAIDNIILDEVQVLIFEKVFEQYDFKRLIGFTGTPTLNKKKYTSIDGVDWVEPYTLSELFDTIVQGPDTQDLIDSGFLVQDYNVVLDLPDFSKLKESDSSPDGYTKQSLNEVYLNTASLKVLTEAYDKHCKGKKTLIFNASTTINEYVLNHFKSLGLNAKMFDTVNTAEINPLTEKRYTREEIIDWFNNERDAILINTNVFTTGFNVRDIEVVIVNRATKSLSLWIQMVGRGSRTTDKIFKDLFTVIDLGQNIYEHGRWSERRDWKNWFYSPGKVRKNLMDMLATWACNSCEALNLKGEVVCEICGANKMDAIIEITEGNKKYKNGELVTIQEMPLPRAKAIIDYTISKKQSSDFAFQLLDRKIIDLFIHYDITKQFYEKRKNTYVDEFGVIKQGFQERIKQIYRPIYFAIIKHKELKGAHKKLDTCFERVITKVEKLYN